MIMELLGASATGFAIGAFVSEAFFNVSRKWFFIIFFVSVFLWSLYGGLIGSAPVVLTNIVIGILTLFIIVRRHNAKKNLIFEFDAVGQNSLVECLSNLNKIRRNLDHDPNDISNFKKFLEEGVNLMTIVCTVSRRFE